MGKMKENFRLWITWSKSVYRGSKFFNKYYHDQRTKSCNITHHTVGLIEVVLANEKCKFLFENLEENAEESSPGM